MADEIPAEPGEVSDNLDDPHGAIISALSKKSLGDWLMRTYTANGPSLSFDEGEVYGIPGYVDDLIYDWIKDAALRDARGAILRSENLPANASDDDVRDAMGEAVDIDALHDDIWNDHVSNWSETFVAFMWNKQIHGRSLDYWDLEVEASFFGSGGDWEAGVNPSIDVMLIPKDSAPLFDRYLTEFHFGGEDVNYAEEISVELGHLITPEPLLKTVRAKDIKIDASTNEAGHPILGETSTWTASFFDEKDELTASDGAVRVEIEEFDIEGTSLRRIAATIPSRHRS